MQLFQLYLDWLSENGYDTQLVKLHTALIFINIAGLHDFPYSDFLFALGQLLLQQEVNYNSPYISSKLVKNEKYEMLMTNLIRNSCVITVLRI